MDREFVFTAVVLTAVGLFFALLGTGYYVTGPGVYYSIPFSFQPFWTHPSISGATSVKPVYYVNFVGVAQLIAAAVLYYMGFTHKEKS